MIDILIDKYNVDKNRVFVTGWSNGAMMNFRLACELSHRISAIAPFAGSFNPKKVTYSQSKGNKTTILNVKDKNGEFYKLHSWNL